MKKHNNLYYKPVKKLTMLADNVTHMDCSQCGDKLQKGLGGSLL